MTAPSLRTPMAALAVAIVLALGLSACSPAAEEAAPTPAAAPAAAPAAEPGAQAAEAAEATANALAALSVPELREKGNAALREQRLYSPSGDNAMEYYLALRQKSATPDVSAESALMDLMPYALIASEQAINDDNFGEAERLLELMSRTDPEAPSLSRIRDAITSGRTAAADRERLDAERAERAERERVAAEQLASQQPATAAPAPAPAAGDTAQATAPAAGAAPATAATTTPPAATEPAPAPVAAAPAPAPAAAPPVRTGPPRAISAPQPPYPREAARNRTAGSVTVSFTIGADGRVSDVQVLRSRPRGLFEDSVRDTVSTWRFEAPGEPITLTRTFDFRM